MALAICLQVTLSNLLTEQICVAVPPSGAIPSLNRGPISDGFSNVLSGFLQLLGRDIKIRIKSTSYE
jgi:hypothetical protein